MEIPNALGAAEISQLRAAFDSDRRQWPDEWEVRGSSRDGGEVGESGRWQSEPCPRSDSFDGLIWHPSTFALLKTLMGEDTVRRPRHVAASYFAPRLRRPLCCLPDRRLQVRFHGLSLMSRDPVSDPLPPDKAAHWQMWCAPPARPDPARALALMLSTCVTRCRHREEGGSFAPDHPFCMRTCMVL